MFGNALYSVSVLSVGLVGCMGSFCMQSVLPNTDSALSCFAPMLAIISLVANRLSL